MTPFDPSSDGINYLVQDSLLAPGSDLDERAASHCGQYGVPARRLGSERIAPTSFRITYECLKPRPVVAREALPVPPKPHPPSASPPHAAPKPNQDRAAAWARATAATVSWEFCLRFDAERLGRESADPPLTVARSVVNACSGLEQAVHDPLIAVGEDSPEFHAQLHARAIQDATETVAEVREPTGGTASSATAATKQVSQPDSAPSAQTGPDATKGDPH